MSTLPRRLKPFAALSMLALAALALPASAQEEPAPGGKLTFGVVTYPPCLDRVQSNPNPVFFHQVVDNLLDQVPETGEIVPYLAERWTVEDEARAYTFHLRDGVSFSNGEKLDAKVVADNFTLTAKLAAQGKASAAQTFLKGFALAEAPDPLTVRIRFSEPNPGFEQAVTEKGLAILAPATLAASLEDRCAKGVIGSGPFVVTELKPKEGATFRKRAEYDWGSAVFRHKGAPYLDTLVIRVIPEASVRVGSLLNGELDGFFDVRYDDHARIQAAGATIVPSTSSGLAGSLMINTSKPGLDELPVRQALQHAINRQELVAGLFGPLVKPASAAVSSNHPSYIDLSAALAYDPVKAARLLDEAGWKPGRDGIRVKAGKRLSIVLLFSGAAEQPSFELIQQQFRQVGIDLRLASVGTAEQVERRAKGDWELDWRTWGRADADVLYYAFSTEASPAKGIAPRPEFEALVNQATVIGDRAARKALADRIQTIALEQGYALPLREVTLFHAVNPKVRGFRVTNDPWRPIFFDVWIKRG